MITIRESNSRGKASLGWLDSRHTFSFGQYYDPHHMGVSALRVINDDKVAPGAGFSTHGHSNMEIISLVTQGGMIHKDSEGNIQSLPAGEYQLMSAGTGIMHSEYNASKQFPLHFLQIWIQPSERDGKPGYQQKRFNVNSGLNLIISPDGRNGTLKIKQDVYLSELNLTSKARLDVPVDKDRLYYLHVISGSVMAEDTIVNEGDGATISALSKVSFTSQADLPLKAIWFDLPRLHETNK